MPPLALLPQLLDRAWYGNSLRAWLTAGTIAIGGFALLLVVRGLVVRRLQAIAKRTATEVDDVAADLMARTRAYFLLAAVVLLASQWLALPARIDRIVELLFHLAFLAQGAVWGVGLIGYWVQRYADRRKAAADHGSVSTIRALGYAAKGLLWAIILITALDSLGVRVTALVTGLGIGGIAIALAVQNVLGDLLAALAIVLDKPFDVGDAIQVDAIVGTVEHIGLKTTRLRSLSGEQVIIANSELLKARIRNYRRQYERRVVLTLDVEYGTPAERLERLPALLREIVERQQPVRFDRSHLAGLLDSSLRLETVYYVLTPDYAQYMDIQQAIALAVLRRFAEEGVQFAYPTRAVVVRGAALDGRVAGGDRDVESETRREGRGVRDEA